MKSTILMVLIAIILSLSNVHAQTKADTTGIKEACANYIEGWYSGDAARMEKALYPELAKRGILPSRDGKTTQVANASFKQMVDWTGKNPNKLKDDKSLAGKIEIIEIGKNIANVKCISKDFIDHLHLGRINGEWKIVNAIWEYNR